MRRTGGADSPAIIRYMGALNARSQSGFPAHPDLLRRSVGLEDLGDLCADLYADFDATLRRAQER